MEPTEVIMGIGVLTDFLFRLGENYTGLTPEEFKAKIDALQVRADDLENWLKK